MFTHCSLIVKRGFLVFFSNANGFLPWEWQYSTKKVQTKMTQSCSKYILWRLELQINCTCHSQCKFCRFNEPTLVRLMLFPRETFQLLKVGGHVAYFMIIISVTPFDSVVLIGCIHAHFRTYGVTISLAFCHMWCVLTFKKNATLSNSD
jgi:hypothetical protein